MRSSYQRKRSKPNAKAWWSPPDKVKITIIYMYLIRIMMVMFAYCYIAVQLYSYTRSPIANHTIILAYTLYYTNSTCFFVTYPNEIQLTSFLTSLAIFMYQQMRLIRQFFQDHVCQVQISELYTQMIEFFLNYTAWCPMGLANNEPLNHTRYGASNL